MPNNWTEYTVEDLKDKQKQAEVFTAMLVALETENACRYVFHNLAEALFGDRLRDE